MRGHKVYTFQSFARGFLIVLMFVVSYVPEPVGSADGQVGECSDNSQCAFLNTECGDGVCVTNQCELHPKNVGVECRATAGLCDVAEACDGENTTCPTNKFLSNAIECRTSSGICDVAELCTGSGADCPVDAFEPASTECRAGAGVCDVAELCTGSSAECPVDLFESNTTGCRASAGVCDAAEMCSGNSAACPADIKSSEVCRASAGDCDLAETCDGINNSCPADAKSTAVCRTAAGLCDQTESCDGLSNDCPTDVVEANTSECRQAAGQCDVAEFCDGILKDCPADAKSTAVCRQAEGLCDVSEACNGINNTCPDDQVEPTSFECRTATKDCELAAMCDGLTKVCPENPLKPDNSTCSDGFFCTTGDVCTQGVCIGSPADCSANNLPGIATCTNSPDDNQFTWDFRQAFTSLCSEGIDNFICSTGNAGISHTCNVTQCSAECDATHTCTNSTCSKIFNDFCEGTKLTEYNNNGIKDNTTVTGSIENSCMGNCLCTANEASCPTPATNSHCVMAACGAECGGNTDCPAFCWFGDLLFTQGTCGDLCQCDYALPEDCNALDDWYDTGNTEWIPLDQCREKERKEQEFKDYSCILGNGECSYVVTDTRLVETGNIRNKPNGTSCNDGEFCTVEDACQSGQCVGLARDCSQNSINIADCNHIPDSIPATFDSFEFTSVCNESAESCTMAPVDYSSLISHVCDMQCGATCVTNTDCSPKCVGDILFSGGTCSQQCACSYQQLDCNHDGWYLNGQKQWVSTGQCTEKEQQQREYRDYRCELSGCTYNVTQTAWEDTGNTRNKDGGTACEDGLFCTEGDNCQAGACVSGQQEKDCSDAFACTVDSCNEQLDQCAHAPDNAICDDGVWCNGQETCNLELGCQGGQNPLDCGPFNLPEIGTCTNIPDGNSMTLDLADGFTSSCDEATHQCTAGSYSFTHTCSVNECDALCDATHACADSTCSATYVDFCIGTKLTEYDNNKIQDNTTVTNAVQNTCNDDCSCTSNEANCPAPGTNTYCVKNVCGAACSTSADCDDQNPATLDSCTQDCGCSHILICGNGQLDFGEQCELPNTQDNEFCSQDTTECSGKMLGTRGALGDCGANCECVADTFSYSCVKGSCGAACASPADCPDQCVGEVWQHAGNCSAGCECSYQSEDCDAQDGLYDTGNTRWVDNEDCTQKKQQQQVQRDYSCSIAGCEFVVNSTQWVDTGNTQNKPNGTSCDDGLPCTVEDSCQAGVCTSGAPKDCSDGIACTADSCEAGTGQCVHAPNDAACDDGIFCNGQETCSVTKGCENRQPIDCGFLDLPAIAQCNNDPDNNDLTFDTAPGFTSTCDEAAKECTRGIYSYSHVCSVAQCSAECDPTHQCADSSCSHKYNDFCEGNKLTEYDGDRIKDSTIVTDADPNTCLESCLCTNNPVDCSAPSTSTYCVKGVCSAECESASDCEPKCQGSVRYFGGTCTGSCECEYSTEDCDEKDGWYDTGQTQWVATGECTEKEQKEQEFRNYHCAPEACEYSIAGTQIIDTGATRNKPGGTACNDGQFCSVNDACSSGQCIGASRDCSANSISIAQCNYVPDNIPTTFDQFSFSSVCDEVHNECTGAPNGWQLSITHTCDKQLCGAECLPTEIDTQSCGFNNVGECRLGTQNRDCGSECMWNPWQECVGEVLPSTESCDDKDNNCDGAIDTITESCAVRFKGICAVGSELCTAGSWSGCPAPKQEICDNNLDDDCDGIVDNGCRNLIIISPESKVYFDRSIELKVDSKGRSDMFYSVDQASYKSLCKSCNKYSLKIPFRYGGHVISVRAEYPDDVVKVETVWFVVSRPDSVKGGTTTWAGNPGSADVFPAGEFKVIETKNFRVPALPRWPNTMKEDFMDSTVKLSMKNLPGISDNEEYVIWMHKAGTNEFLKVGVLKLNRRQPGSTDPFRTGIIGYFSSQGNFLFENLMDSYDAAFIEKEPSGYNLPYPIGNALSYFSKAPPKNFLQQGFDCVADTQCMSGDCVNNVCSGTL